MTKISLLLIAVFSVLFASAQNPLPPDEIYGQLFKDVQLSGIFPDQKTFVDCVPRRTPEAIVADYTRIKNNPAIRFSLKDFVEQNFILPVKAATSYSTAGKEPAATHIRNLWQVLKRKADTAVAGSSLLPLPNAYIVPGGRFGEIYYWDSYFTMLGLQQSGEYESIESMVKNFAYLIARYGHIPNGNRTYYLSRSQPPFFSMMVALLAESKGRTIYKTYLPALLKEYGYWMEGAGEVPAGQAYKRVVKLADSAILNRYWDDDTVPRQESYAKDLETAEKTPRKKIEVYRDLRAGAASGWDFSSRWFADASNLTTIQTTAIVPIDLNCLLYMLESNIAKASRQSGDDKTSAIYAGKASKRKAAILQYCWNNREGYFTDYNLQKKEQDTILTAASLFPLFTQLATPVQASKVAAITKFKLLKYGGVITTNNRTGQQWDSPNGWAPLQWVAVKGLENYGYQALAKDIALRWLALNDKVFKATGKMMEKYNVLDTNLEAGGGEYPGQDGFGWTNGVYLKLDGLYRTKSSANKNKPAVEQRELH